MEELDFNMDSFQESEENELDTLFKEQSNTEDVLEDSEKNIISEANIKPEDVAEEEDEEVQGKSPEISEMYSSLANLLTEKGLLSTSNTIKTEEDFVEAYKESIKSQELSDLSDVQKRYLESIRAGIPDDLFFKYENNNSILENISDTDIEDESNEELRSDLIKQGFLIKGLSEDKAIKLTKKIIDSGEDIDEAKEAYSDILKYNKNKQQEEVEAVKKAKADRLVEENRKIEDFKTTVTSSNEIIKGLKLTDQTKKEVIDSYTKIAGYTEDGRPYNKIAEAQLKDPVDFQFKMAYLFSITKGFKDFNIFTTKKTAESAAEKKLSKILRGSSNDFGGNSPINDDEDTFSIEDLKLDL